MYSFKNGLTITLFLCFFHFIISFSFSQGFTDASEFGFSPNASGIENMKALQKAVDQQGTIIVSQQGTYKMAGTVYVGGQTTLIFGNNVFLQKVDEQGPFTHVLLNKGALTKTYDEHIVIRGLQVKVNGIDKAFTEVYGLRGQIAFFYVKDLKIEGFRLMDLERAQFGIHVCTFEDLIIDDVIIRGNKDGVHLGRGKRFTIRNGVFQTFDDAIALNAHDYATSNPELGWIEDGLVENCHDLNQDNTTGYFCRILAGGWIDWKENMEVQQSDIVVSNNKIYRVQAKPDGTVYTSKTQPAHESGSKVIDGINWGVVQEDIFYTAGVRNVTFRDIYLSKPRIAFSVHFDNDKYSRSYYPGAEIPMQRQLIFENIRVLYDEAKDFISVGTPVDVLSIQKSSLKKSRIFFRTNEAMKDYLPTHINVNGCIFNQKGDFDFVVNSVPGKEIFIRTSSNTVLDTDTKIGIIAGKGKVRVTSDLPGWQ